VQEIVATLGTGFSYENITDEAWAEAAGSRINAHAVAHLSKLWAALRTQPRDVRVTDTIEKLAGRKPKTFAEFVADSRAAQPSGPSRRRWSSPQTIAARRPERANNRRDQDGRM
jgi:hypothetical protein